MSHLLPVRGQNTVRTGYFIYASSVLLDVGPLRLGRILASYFGEGVSPGFDARDVLTMKMSLTLDTTEATARLVERVVSRLETLPGVRAVANVTALPLEQGPDLPFEIVGHSASEDNMPDEQVRAASPHYFSVMRIPVVAGRAFTERDTQSAPAVVIINQALVRKYFAKRNPLGERLLIGRVMGPRFADVTREIIGVVGDTHEESLGSSAPPMLFEPLAQVPDAITAMDNRILALNWVIKTSDRSPALTDQIRRETVAVSGGVPMGQPRLLEQVVGDSIARQRFSMTLLAVFAFVALLLAGIGLYGVISYSLAQRTREIGIRSALGADRRDLLVLVIGQGMKLAFAGLAAGLCIALGLTRYLESLLYEVTPSDPFVLASVTGILAGVALLASWLPANHASRIDPVRALREQ